MASTLPTYTKPLVGGDVIIREWAREYTREEVTIANATSADYAMPAGYPINTATSKPVLTTAEANTYGFTVEPVTIVAGETRTIAIIVRGPAVINQDALPVLDVAGAALVPANMVTSTHLGTPGLIFRRQPSTKETQTT